MQISGIKELQRCVSEAGARREGNADNEEGRLEPEVLFFFGPFFLFHGAIGFHRRSVRRNRHQGIYYKIIISFCFNGD